MLKTTGEIEMNESVEELLDVLEPLVREDSVSALTESIRIEEAKKVYEKYRPPYGEEALDRLDRLEITLCLTGDIPSWAETLQSDDHGTVTVVGSDPTIVKTLIRGDHSRSGLKAMKKCAPFGSKDLNGYNQCVETTLLNTPPERHL